MAPPPTPWPRLRDAWWVYALAAVAVVIFPVALVVELQCGLRRCTGSLGERLLALDALGGLPRLYTSGLFAAVAVLSWVARRRAADRAQLWWTAIASIGAALALMKLLSTHSAAEGTSAVATLIAGVVLTVLVLGALAVTGRRWEIAPSLPVVLALAVYAAVALGLNAVTTGLMAVQDRVGLLPRTAATFGEELGEAMAALFVLVTVRWNLPVAAHGGDDPSRSRSPAGLAADGQEFAGGTGGRSNHRPDSEKVTVGGAPRRRGHRPGRTTPHRQV